MQEEKREATMIIVKGVTIEDIPKSPRSKEHPMDNANMLKEKERSQEVIPLDREGEQVREAQPLM